VWRSGGRLAVADGARWPAMLKALKPQLEAIAAQK